MNHDVPVTRIAIVGGGLAGLSLAILCVKKGLQVTVFEKGDYPSHKVCGEYISLESWKFITKELDIDLESLNLPIIKQLIVSHHDGAVLNAPLPLGGFGISRYTIDELLYKKAIALGVTIHTLCTIHKINFTDQVYTLKDHNESSYEADLCVAAYGKRSNLDNTLHRKFFINSKEKDNYIAVKYHIKATLPHDTIALHNFDDGYCGISKIEDDLYCLCYLTTSKNLKKYHSIELMEQNILYKNPHLKKIFTESTFVWTKPITISQINFSSKELVKDHIIFIGDSAAVIQPLCGNGMSMAMHTSYLLHNCITNYLVHRDLYSLHNEYIKKWKRQFKVRLSIAHILKNMFGKNISTLISVSILKKMPKITQAIIRLTHGNHIIS